MAVIPNTQTCRATDFDGKNDETFERASFCDAFHSEGTPPHKTTGAVD
jgi:hypothetical protein